MNPIDFHYHGIDGFDLQNEPDMILDGVEKMLGEEGARAILTFGIPESMFLYFIKFMEAFNQRSLSGKNCRVVGIAIEGPLLASPGGTPRQGVWLPTVEQWEQIADCGILGLKYAVISPDADLAAKHLRSVPHGRYPQTIEWIVNTLLDGNVLPSLGHFGKNDPQGSVQAIQLILNLITNRGNGPIVTDHLFNDMPLNFKHAWRTPDERYKRDVELADLGLSSWNWTNIDEKMGPVPAALLHGAKQGLLKICLNFDGEHVDLAICKKTVEIVGADNIMIMTDRFPQEIAGGKVLIRKDGSTLLYQEQEIVAGGTQGVLQQIANMRSIGISDNDIEKMVWIVPSQFLNLPSNLV
jgi:N-acetylglucosamine-6-phosphate deacetylase